MECITKNRDGADVLIDYCSGALDEGRAAEIEKHIGRCADCLRMVEAQRELWSSLDGWTAPEVSQNFDARLYARIAEENQLPAWRQWLRRIFEPAVPIAAWKPAVSLAAACAALTIGLVVQNSQTPHSAPAQKAQLTQIHPDRSIDIEQVADALDDLELLSPSAM